MNKHRNKVVAKMMVVAITVSSVAVPVESAVIGSKDVDIHRKKKNL